MIVHFTIPDKSWAVELVKGVDNMQQFGYGVRYHGVIATANIRVGFDGKDLFVYGDIHVAPEPGEGK